MSHRTQCAKTHPATKNALAAWIPACHGNDNFVTYIDGIKSGKNSGRIFRLSAPGAPTTAPDHTKEQKAFLGTLWADKEYLARIKPC